MKRAALALLLVGCTQRTDLLPPDDGGVMACSGLGLPVRLGGPNASCAGVIAAVTVNRALCSCDSLILPGGLTTEAGGQGQGTMPGPPAPSAAVASDGSIEVGGLVQIAGSVSAGATDGIGFNRTASIFGSLRSAGSLSAAQIISVAGDAYVAGDVLGRVEVLGNLFVSPSSNVSALAAGNNFVVRQPIAIEPPCGCATGPIVDVDALVSVAANANDDVTGGIDPAALASTHGPTAFDLPCGSYFLPSLTTDDTLEVRVHGRSALYIDGDVTLADGLRVTLDSGAELDLFVTGNVTLNAGVLGAPSAAAVRLWLAGTTIQLGLDASLSAIVYAPDATLLGDQDLVATGALFVGRVAALGDLTVRFDPDVLDDGATCGQPTVPVPF
jgi:hypothetical protein